jgi:hypothetical protein
MKPSSKGLRSQAALYRWFRTVVQTPSMDLQTGGGNARYYSAILAVQKALRDGWTLTMSSDNSPADKAGVDFVWANKSRGIWFALDTTYKDKVGVPSLIHLVKLVNTNDQIIGSRLSFQSHLGFLELLVELCTDDRALLTNELPPPEMTAVTDLRKSLESFQARLAKIGTRPASAPFAEWATYLNGAIGYQGKADKGQYTIDASLIGFAIGTAVEAFLNARKGGCPEFDRGGFQRGKHISYSETADTLHVSDPVNPIWPGIKTRIQQQFDKEYAALVKLENGGLQLLLIAKQMFSAQGINWVIHHILDVVEAKSAGRNFNAVQPKMKAPELPVAAPPVRRQTANERLFAHFANENAPSLLVRASGA